MHRAVPRRPRLSLLRRSGLVTALGTAALFVVALLVGMAWFSPDTGSAQRPQADPSTPLSSSPSTPAPSSSPSQPAAQETQKLTDNTEPRPDKPDKHGGKGKH